MKKIILFCLAFVAFFSVKAENYMFGELSYDNTHMGYKSTFPDNDLMISSMGLNGFGLQYTYGFGITDRPMNVEVGAKWSMVFGGKTVKDIPFTGVGEEINTHVNLMRLAIPVSYIYHFPLMGKLAIAPYLGLDLRFNLMSQLKVKYTEYLNGDYVDQEKLNLSYFNKKDMDGHPASRFQLGWHLGVRIEGNQKYFLDIQYGTDFVRFYNHTLGEANAHINTGNFSLGLGYYFK